MNKSFIKIVTFIILITLLSQNIVWAEEPGMLMPESEVEWLGKLLTAIGRDPSGAWEQFKDGSKLEQLTPEETGRLREFLRKNWDSLPGHVKLLFSKLISPKDIWQIILIYNEAIEELQGGITWERKMQLWNERNFWRERIWDIFKDKNKDRKKLEWKEFARELDIDPKVLERTCYDYLLEKYMGDLEAIERDAADNFNILNVQPNIEHRVRFNRLLFKWYLVRAMRKAQNGEELDRQERQAIIYEFIKGNHQSDPTFPGFSYTAKVNSNSASKVRSYYVEFFLWRRKGEKYDLRMIGEVEHTFNRGADVIVESVFDEENYGWLFKIRTLDAGAEAKVLYFTLNKDKNKMDLLDPVQQSVVDAIKPKENIFGRPTIPKTPPDEKLDTKHARMLIREMIRHNKFSDRNLVLFQFQITVCERGKPKGGVLIFGDIEEHKYCAKLEGKNLKPNVSYQITSYFSEYLGSWVFFAYEIKDGGFIEREPAIVFTGRKRNGKTRLYQLTNREIENIYREKHIEAPRPETVEIPSNIKELIEKGDTLEGIKDKYLTPSQLWQIITAYSEIIEELNGKITWQRKMQLWNERNFWRKRLWETFKDEYKGKKSLQWERYASQEGIDPDLFQRVIYDYLLEVHRGNLELIKNDLTELLEEKEQDVEQVIEKKNLLPKLYFTRALGKRGDLDDNERAEIAHEFVEGNHRADPTFPRFSYITQTKPKSVPNSCFVPFLYWKRQGGREYRLEVTDSMYETFGSNTNVRVEGVFDEHNYGWLFKVTGHRAEDKVLYFRVNDDKTKMDLIDPVQQTVVDRILSKTNVFGKPVAIRTPPFGELDTRHGRRLIREMIRHNKFKDSSLTLFPFCMTTRVGHRVEEVLDDFIGLKPGTDYRIEFFFSKRMGQWLCLAYEVLEEGKIADTPSVVFSGKEEGARTRLYQLSEDEVSQCIGEIKSLEKDMAVNAIRRLFGTDDSKKIKEIIEKARISSEELCELLNAFSDEDISEYLKKMGGAEPSGKKPRKELWQRLPLDIHRNFIKRLLSELERVRKIINKGEKDHPLIRELEISPAGRRIIKRLKSVGGDVRFRDLRREVFSISIGRIPRGLLLGFYHLYDRRRRSKKLKISTLGLIAKTLGFIEEKKKEPTLEEIEERISQEFEAGDIQKENTDAAILRICVELGIDRKSKWRKEVARLFFTYKFYEILKEIRERIDSQLEGVGDEKEIRRIRKRELSVLRSGRFKHTHRALDARLRDYYKAYESVFERNKDKIEEIMGFPLDYRRYVCGVKDSTEIIAWLKGKTKEVPGGFDIHIGKGGIYTLICSKEIYINLTGMFELRGGDYWMSFEQDKKGRNKYAVIWNSEDSADIEGAEPLQRFQIVEDGVVLAQRWEGKATNKTPTKLLEKDISRLIRRFLLKDGDIPPGFETTVRGKRGEGTFPVILCAFEDFAIKISSYLSSLKGKKVWITFEKDEEGDKYAVVWENKEASEDKTNPYGYLRKYYLVRERVVLNQQEEKDGKRAGTGKSPIIYTWKDHLKVIIEGEEIRPEQIASWEKVGVLVQGLLHKDTNIADNAKKALSEWTNAEGGVKALLGFMAPEDTSEEGIRRNMAILGILEAFEIVWTIVIEHLGQFRTCPYEELRNRAIALREKLIRKGTLTDLQLEEIIRGNPDIRWEALHDRCVIHRMAEGFKRQNIDVSGERLFKLYYKIRFFDYLKDLNKRFKGLKRKEKKKRVFESLIHSVVLEEIHEIVSGLRRYWNGYRNIFKECSEEIEDIFGFKVDYERNILPIGRRPSGRQPLIDWISGERDEIPKGTYYKLTKNWSLQLIRTGKIILELSHGLGGLTVGNEYWVSFEVEDGNKIATVWINEEESKKEGGKYIERFYLVKDGVILAQRWKGKRTRLFPEPFTRSRNTQIIDFVIKNGPLPEPHEASVTANGSFPLVLQKRYWICIPGGLARHRGKVWVSYQKAGNNSYAVVWRNKKDWEEQKGLKGYIKRYYLVKDGIPLAQRINRKKTNKKPSQAPPIEDDGGFLFHFAKEDKRDNEWQWKVTAERFDIKEKDLIRAVVIYVCEQCNGDTQKMAEMVGIDNDALTGLFVAGFTDREDIREVLEKPVEDIKIDSNSDRKYKRTWEEYISKRPYLLGLNIEHPVHILGVLFKEIHRCKPQVDRKDLSGTVNILAEMLGMAPATVRFHLFLFRIIPFSERLYFGQEKASQFEDSWRRYLEKDREAQGLNIKGLEARITYLLGKGYTNDGIAEILGIGENDVVMLRSIFGIGKERGTVKVGAETISVAEIEAGIHNEYLLRCIEKPFTGISEEAKKALMLMRNRDRVIDITRALANRRGRWMQPDKKVVKDLLDIIEAIDIPDIKLLELIRDFAFSYPDKDINEQAQRIYGHLNVKMEEERHGIKVEDEVRKIKRQAIFLKKEEIRQRFVSGLTHEVRNGKWTLDELRMRVRMLDLLKQIGAIRDAVRTEIKGEIDTEKIVSTVKEKYPWAEEKRIQHWIRFWVRRRIESGVPSQRAEVPPLRRARVDRESVEEYEGEEEAPTESEEESETVEFKPGDYVIVKGYEGLGKGVIMDIDEDEDKIVVYFQEKEEERTFSLGKVKGLLRKVSSTSPTTKLREAGSIILVVYSIAGVLGIIALIIGILAYRYWIKRRGKKEEIKIPMLIGKDTEPYRRLLALKRKARRLADSRKVTAKDLQDLDKEMDELLAQYSHLDIRGHPFYREFMSARKGIEDRLRRQERRRSPRPRPERRPPTRVEPARIAEVPPPVRPTGPEREMGEYLKGRFSPPVVEELVRKGMRLIKQGVLEGGATPIQLAEYLALLEENRLTGRFHTPVRLISSPGAQCEFFNRRREIVGIIPDLIVLKQGAEGWGYEHLKKHLPEFKGIDSEEQLLFWLVKTVREGYKRRYSYKGDRGIEECVECTLYRKETNQSYIVIIGSDDSVITFYPENFNDFNLSERLSISPEQVLLLFKILTDRIPVTIDRDIPDPASIRDLVIGYERNIGRERRIQRRIYYFPKRGEDPPAIGVWHHYTRRMVLMDLNGRVFDVRNADSSRDKIDITGDIHRIDQYYLRENVRGSHSSFIPPLGLGIGALAPIILGVVSVAFLVIAGYLYWRYRKGKNMAVLLLGALQEREDKLRGRKFELRHSRENEFSVYENSERAGDFRVKYDKKNNPFKAILDLGDDRYTLDREDIEKLQLDRFLSRRRLLFRMGLLAAGGALFFKGLFAYLFNRRFIEPQRPLTKLERGLIEEFKRLASEIEDPQSYRYAIKFINKFIRNGRLAFSKEDISDLSMGDNPMEYKILDDRIVINYPLYKSRGLHPALVQGCMVHEGKHIEDSKRQAGTYGKTSAMQKVTEHILRTIGSITEKGREGLFSPDGTWIKCPNGKFPLYQFHLLVLYHNVNNELPAHIAEYNFYRRIFGDLRSFTRGFREDNRIYDIEERLFAEAERAWGDLVLRERFEYGKRAGLFPSSISWDEYTEYYLKGRLKDLQENYFYNAVNPDGSINERQFRRNYFMRVMQNRKSPENKFFVDLVLLVEERRRTIEFTPDGGYRVINPDRFLDWLDTGFFVDEDGNSVNLMELDLTVPETSPAQGQKPVHSFALFGIPAAVFCMLGFVFGQLWTEHGGWWRFRKEVIDDLKLRLHHLCKIIFGIRKIKIPRWVVYIPLILLMACRGFAGPVQPGLPQPQPKPPPAVSQAFDVDEFVERVTDYTRISKADFEIAKEKGHIEKNLSYQDFIRFSLSDSQKEIFKKLIKLFLELEYEKAASLLQNVDFIIIGETYDSKASMDVFGPIEKPMFAIFIGKEYLLDGLRAFNSASLVVLIAVIHESTHILDYLQFGWDIYMSEKYYRINNEFFEQKVFCNVLFWWDKILVYVREGKLPQEITSEVSEHMEYDRYTCTSKLDPDPEYWGREWLLSIDSYLEKTLNVSSDRIEYISIERDGENIIVWYMIDEKRTLRIEIPIKGLKPTNEIPGGRWPWLKDLLAKYGLPAWLQVPIEQAFIWMGYVLYFTGFPILASFVLPVFIGLHYVWKKGREPSIRDILMISLINLIGVTLAIVSIPILGIVMFTLSSIAHYFYNTLVTENNLPQEDKPVFKEGGEYAALSVQTIKDLMIFEPGIGLFDFVNETITPWGEKRLMWLLTHPYLDEKEILARQEFVCYLMNNPAILMQIREILAVISQQKDINGILRARKYIESLPKGNIYYNYFHAVIQEFMQRPWDRTLQYKVLGLIGELDAFSSLAQSGLRYACSKQNGHITMPRILEQAEPLFQMKQGIMPGKLWQGQVPNDIEISSEKRFALITGPNSSGKTMLLRTIGRMAILSQIGSPVPAEDMVITPMRIHSLISISDDPQTCRSYTEVEVDELSGILDSTEKGTRQLYLIDEMLRGVYRNARDTIEPDVVKLLANSGALTVLTTHNSSLTELAEEDKNIANYHFTDVDYEKHRYRLMHGRTTINNAIRIIEGMGWRELDLPRPKYPDRYVEPTVVSVENESIQGKKSNIFNKGAVLVWKGLVESLTHRINRLKEKIEEEREISGWDMIGFGSFFIAAMLGAFIQDPSEIKSKFFGALVLTLLFFMIIPLLIRLYFILERYLSLIPKKKLLEKILQKEKESVKTKPPVQQALEGYLEKTAGRPGDIDTFMGVKKHIDTYPIEETTARVLEITGGENNLFSTIDNTHTIWGRQRLNWLLTNPYKNTERIRNRQQTVRILSEKKKTREGLTRYLEELGDSWQTNIVSQKPPRINNTFKIAFFLGLIISVIAHSQAMVWYFAIGAIIAVFAFLNWLFFNLHAKEVKALAYVNDVIRIANKLKKALEDLGIDNNPEIEQLLKDLDTVNSALEKLKTGTGLISRLKTIFTMDETRHNLIQNMFFKKADSDRRWVDWSEVVIEESWIKVLSAIGEIDAYLSLAELPERFPHWKTMPEIAESDGKVPVLDIKEGYCPTIPLEISQPNSVLFNGDNRVLAISGAHGAGKSTFLRTLNQLEILGSIGSFVPAKQMRFTPVQILVSMNVQDAPGEGLGYFGKVAQFLRRLYWELELRPSYYDEKRPLHVVSFDEFLEGTNTPEERIIAEAVIKWLSEHDMPAVIVTQDTEVLKIIDAKRMPKVNIAHPEGVLVSGKRFAYKIVPGLPDEVAICRELLKRPLNRHLYRAILKIIQGKAEDGRGDASPISQYPGEGRSVSYAELKFDDSTITIRKEDYANLINLLGQHIDNPSALRDVLRKNISGADTLLRDFFIEALIEALTEINKSPHRDILIHLLFNGIFGNDANQGQDIVIRVSPNLTRNSSRYYVDGKVVIVFNSEFIKALTDYKVRNAGWLFCERLFHELYHKNPSAELDRIEEETRVITGCDLMFYEFIGQHLVKEEDLEKIKALLRSGRYFRFLQSLLDPSKWTNEDIDLGQRVEQLGGTMYKYKIGPSRFRKEYLGGCAYWKAPSQGPDQSEMQMLEAIKQMDISRIHGNVLRNKKTGKGILILGKNETGKSSTALHLVSSDLVNPDPDREWEFVSDDVSQAFFIGSRLIAGWDCNIYKFGRDLRCRYGGDRYLHTNIFSARTLTEIDQIIYLDEQIEGESVSVSEILARISEEGSHKGFSSEFAQKLRNISMHAIPIPREKDDATYPAIARRIEEIYWGRYIERTVRRYVMDSQADGQVSDTCCFPAGGKRWVGGSRKAQAEESAARRLIVKLININKSVTEEMVRLGKGISKEEFARLLGEKSTRERLQGLGFDKGMIDYLILVLLGHRQLNVGPGFKIKRFHGMLYYLTHPEVPSQYKMRIEERPEDDRFTVLLVIPPIKQEELLRNIGGMGYLGAALNSKEFLGKFYAMKKDLGDTVPDYRVRILDLGLANKDPEFNFDEYLKALRPDMVCVTAISETYPEAVKIAQKAKEIVPNALRVTGGYHTGVLPVETLRESDFEVVVRNYGEETLAELAGRFSVSGRDGLYNLLPHIEGITYKTQSGEITQNPDRRYFLEPDDYPFLHESDDLYVYSGYQQDEIEGKKIAYIYASRGCPFDCLYCSGRAITKRGVRHRSPKNVLEEIRVMYDKGRRLFSFRDESFTLNRSWLSEILDGLEEMKREGKEIKWIMQTRADLLDEELLKRMKNTGLTSIAFGIESGNIDLMQEIKNDPRLDIDKIRFNLKTAKELGIYIHGFFLVGVPGQDWADILDSATFIDEVGFDSVSVFTLVPYPGTRYYSNGTLRIEKGNITDRFSEYKSSTENMCSEEIASARYLLELIGIVLTLRSMGKQKGDQMPSIGDMLKPIINVIREFRIVDLFISSMPEAKWQDRSRIIRDIIERAHRDSIWGDVGEMFSRYDRDGLSLPTMLNQDYRLEVLGLGLAERLPKNIRHHFIHQAMLEQYVDNFLKNIKFASGKGLFSRLRYDNTLTLIKLLAGLHFIVDGEIESVEFDCEDESAFRNLIQALDKITIKEMAVFNENIDELQGKFRIKGYELRFFGIPMRLNPDGKLTIFTSRIDINARGFELIETEGEINKRDMFSRFYRRLVRLVKEIYPKWEVIDEDTLWQIVTDGKLPSGWPGLVTAMRHDGVIDKDDFILVSAIGEVLEDTDLRDEIKALLTEAISIDVLLEDGRFRSEFMVKLRKDLSHKGDVAKVVQRLYQISDNIIFDEQTGEVKFRSIEDYCFIIELERLLGYEVYNEVMDRYFERRIRETLEAHSFVFSERQLMVLDARDQETARRKFITLAAKYYKGGLPDRLKELVERKLRSKHSKGKRALTLYEEYRLFTEEVRFFQDIVSLIPGNVELHPLGGVLQAEVDRSV